MLSLVLGKRIHDLILIYQGYFLRISLHKASKNEAQGSLDFIVKHFFPKAKEQIFCLKSFPNIWTSSLRNFVQDTNTNNRFIAFSPQMVSKSKQ